MPSLIYTKFSSGEFHFTLEARYFDELLMDKENGRLYRDPACHALWYYNYLATQQYLRAKANIVDEEDLSLIFDRQRAETIMAQVAQMYGTTPTQMIKYWDNVEKQMAVLGYTNNLPEQFHFKF
jgi:hypothetical protein